MKAQYKYSFNKGEEIISGNFSGNELKFSVDYKKDGTINLCRFLEQFNSIEEESEELIDFWTKIDEGCTNFKCYYIEELNNNALESLIINMPIITSTVFTLNSNSGSGSGTNPQENLFLLEKILEIG